MKQLIDADHSVYLTPGNSAVVRSTKDGLWHVTLGTDYTGTFASRKDAEEAAQKALEDWDDARAKVAAQNALQAVKEILAPVIAMDAFDPQALSKQEQATLTLAKLLHKAIIDNGAG
jgi:hypothetical protein